MPNKPESQGQDLELGKRPSSPADESAKSTRRSRFLKKSLQFLGVTAILVGAAFVGSALVRGRSSRDSEAEDPTDSDAYDRDVMPFSPQQAVGVSSVEISDFIEASSLGLDQQRIIQAATLALGKNTLSIERNQTVTITPEFLSVVGSDGNSEFIISDIEGGRFASTENPGQEITRFLPSDVDQEFIQFIHDGSTVAPTYKVSISDGVETTAGELASVEFFTRDVVKRVGSEFQINTFTTGDQGSSSVAALPDGRFVDVWHSDGQDGSSYGIYVQFFDSSKNKVGSEIQVNTFTDNYQVYPTVAVLSDGRIVVIWNSLGQDGSELGVYGQLLDSSGNKVGGEFCVNTVTDGNQGVSSVTALPDGEFVVIWHNEDESGPNNGIYGQMYDSSGNKVGDEFEVATYSYIADEELLDSSVAASPNGNFMVVWQDGSGLGVDGQLFDVSGDEVGGKFQVNTVTTGSQGVPSVAALPNGYFVVTWQHDALDGSNPEIRVQLLDSSRNKIGDEFTANTFPIGSQSAPSVAALPNGDFVITWDNDGSNGSVLGVRGQLFDALRKKRGDEFQANTFSTDSQSAPSVAGLTNDEFVITWENYGVDGSGKGVSGQIFCGIDVAPTLVENTLTVEQDQRAITLTDENLSVTDPDDVGSTLIYSFYEVLSGQFELVSDPGIPITNCTQAELFLRQVIFSRDGTGDEPSYETAVSDGMLSTSPLPANIIFIANDPLNPMFFIIGGSAGLVLTAVGVIRKMRRNSFEKTINPLTRRVDFEIPASEIVVGKKIGEGSFGMVFKGEWGSGKTPVVIKQVNISEKEGALQEFINEFRVMASIRYANVIDLYGTTVVDGKRCIVMEYMPRGSLDGVLWGDEKREQLPQLLRLKIACDVARGVLFLHKQDPPILHRDLKSLNILLNQELSAKVSDFGESITEKESDILTQTGKDQIAGSVLWMAPELLRDKGAPYTTKCDVFSFGVILWELMSCRPPFTGGGGRIPQPMTAVGMRLNQLYRDPIPEDCPPACSKLIEDCWAENSKKRPEMEDVVKRLQAIYNEVRLYSSASLPAPAVPQKVRGRKKLQATELRTMVSPAATATTGGRSRGAPLVIGRGIVSRGGGDLVARPTEEKTTKSSINPESRI
jgi:hypothetical protein